ncbi:MAG: hypothetical protein WCV88_03505 [Patescibacteria group bacterium]|jgi:hypothetical protein
MSSIAIGANYIQQCRTLGFSDSVIAQALQKSGWMPADIQTAMQQANIHSKKTKSTAWLWIALTILIVVAWLSLTA